MRIVRCGLAGAAGALALTACTGAEGTSATDLTPGDAVVALAASTAYAEKGDVEGRVVLVDADGRTTVRETDGVYGGQAGWAGGALHVADADSDLRWTGDGVTESERSAEGLTQVGAATAGDLRVSVLAPDGAGSLVVASGPDGVASTRLPEEVRAVAGCGERAYGVLAGGDVVALEPQDGEVVVSAVTTLGRRGLDPRFLGCLDEGLAVLATGGDEVLLGVSPTTDGAIMWGGVDLDPSSLPVGAAQVGAEAVWVADDGAVTGVDLGSGDVRDHGALAPADLYRAAAGPAGELVVAAERGDDVEVSVFSAPGGEEVLDLVVPGLAAQLADDGLLLGPAPALNPDWAGLRG